jgi:hypothetical protein
MDQHCRDVRFGSKADIAALPINVRFTPVDRYVLEQARSALVILPITTRGDISGLSEIALPVGLVFDRSARVEIVACIPV